jgi:hypothetical protein
MINKCNDCIRLLWGVKWTIWWVDLDKVNFYLCQKMFALKFSIGKSSIVAMPMKGRDATMMPGIQLLVSKKILIIRNDYVYR